NALTLYVRLRTTRALLDCAHHLHDVGTAALGTMSDVDLLRDGVALTWQVPGASGQRAIVERSDDAYAWSGLGDAVAVAGGVFRFEDHGAARGATYYYHLVSDRSVPWTSVAPVTVPSQASFALHVQSANPGSGGWTLAVELPRAGVAQVSLYDVAGRRVESYDVRRDSPGRTLLTLGTGVRPGVYTVVARFGAARTQAGLVLYR